MLRNPHYECGHFASTNRVKTAFMQVQAIISGAGYTRVFRYFCIRLFAAWRGSCHSTSARVAPGQQWFENPAVDGASQRLVTAAGSQHSLTGVDTRKLSQFESRQLGAGRTIIAECSPPMKYTCSSPCSNAPGMPSPRPPTRSPQATSFNSVPAPIRTGKPLSYWFAACMLMGVSVARSCGRIVAAMLWRGTRTGRRQSPKSAAHPSLNLRCASDRGATTDPRRVYIILSANCLDARRERPSGERSNSNWWGSLSIRYRKWNPIPDNEHYAAPCRSP